MRQFLKERDVGLDPNFRYRGKNQTRVETFTDAAFALAITLLVLSSTVPNTFLELKMSMRFVAPFGMCVVLLTVIWYQHYLFFLKYGLQDTTTVSINTILIFLILVYVYPLKFLSRLLFELTLSVIYRDFSFLASFGDFNRGDLKFLMVIYGLGATLIFLTIAILYWYAYKRREELDLDRYERFSTRLTIVTNLLLAAVPLITVIIAIWDPFGNPGFAGMFYFLYPPVMIVYGILAKRKEQKLFGKAG